MWASHALSTPDPKSWIPFDKPSGQCQIPICTQLIHPVKIAILCSCFILFWFIIWYLNVSHTYYWTLYPPFISIYHHLKQGYPQNSPNIPKQSSDFRTNPQGAGNAVAGWGASTCGGELWPHAAGGLCSRERFLISPKMFYFRWNWWFFTVFGGGDWDVGGKMNGDEVR